MPAALKTSFRFRCGSSVTEVVVGEGAVASLGARLPRIARGSWFVVSSPPVFERHGAALLAGACGAKVHEEPLLVPDGERAKTWPVLGRLLSGLLSCGLRRDGGVVAFGGGTVGDVGGMAASLALRGVPVVQVPTTLLAASDSALGGKTAVDLAAGKNLAGTFHPPRLVAADTRFLSTLSERDYRSGLAEVVKSSMLAPSFDRAMPRLLAALGARHSPAVAEAVLRSLRMKAGVVEADPEERLGLRAVLNLGHTVGHALEAASRFRLLHGEAVAWGLLAALRLSVVRGGLPPGEAERLAERVLTLAAPPRLPPGVLGGWRGFLPQDKKADGAGLKAVVLSRPGRARLVRVTIAELDSAFGDVLGRYNTGASWR